MLLLFANDPVTRQGYFSVWVGNCGNLSYGATSDDVWERIESQSFPQDRLNYGSLKFPGSQFRPAIDCDLRNVLIIY